jgi:hypothetical protein
VAEQTGADQSHIWITNDLRLSAQAVINSWNQTHTEKLAELDVDSVHLKFTDVGTQKNFLHRLNQFAERIRGHLSSGVPLPVSGDATNLTVMIRLEFFRPDVFSDLLADLSKTEMAAIPILAEVREQAELYLAAFSIPFVRADICAGAEVDQDILAKVEQAVVDSQKLLIEFLKQLRGSLPNENEHLVIIRGADEFEVDSVPKKFDGAALRAFLTLALLRGKREFKVDEFAEKYNGKKPVEARHDFDNGFHVLQKELPKISRQASDSNRTVSGIKFRVLANDVALTERLLNLHKK